MSKLELLRPSEELTKSYLEFISEMRSSGEKIWESNVPRDNESAANFVARLLRAESFPEPGLVNESSYWAVLDKEVVGRIALRHTLNKSLEEFGGHIGYEVRPSARRKGLATKMLRLILEKPKAKEIGRVLLTCSPDNTASNKTILKNGGLFSGTKFVDRFQRQTNYYWIDIGAAKI